ncbi:hypothetical protein [Nocardia sp. NPDC004711]
MAEHSVDNAENLDNSTVFAIVRDVIAIVSPDELPIIDGMAGFDASTITQRLEQMKASREPLGFGVAAVAALATPVVWIAVNRAADRLGVAVGDGAASAMKTLTRKVFRRKAEQPRRMPPLTEEQLAEIQRQALEIAGQRGLDEARAQAIADGLVVRLMLTAANKDESSPPTPSEEERRSGTSPS